MAQLRCAECDFQGAGTFIGERLHRVRHDEHRNGVRLRTLNRFESVGTLGSCQVLLVRPDSDIFARRRTERVARRAVREPIFEGGYDTPTYYADNVYQIVPEMHSHALLVANDRRGVGLAVIERRSREAWYDWCAPDGAYQMATQDGAGVSWAIVHVWILPACRCRGLATQLLEFAFRGFGLDPTVAG